MYTTLVGLASIFTYIIASVSIIKDTITATAKPSTRAAWLAVALHFSYTIANTHYQNGFNFSFFNTASLIALAISSLLLIAELDKPVIKLGTIIFPIAALILALNIVFPAKSHPAISYNWRMDTHILTSIIAFSLLNIAALQAILLAIQEQQLRRHHPRRLMLALPPLQAMESLLFQIITAGLVFLTASLVSGFFFIDNLFAQHLAHKTVLSILAWIIFSGLLFGRVRYGWRGQSAIRWTLMGFTSLLLAYFGSKLVLELILQKV